jgi:hypothetical protein
MEHFEELGDICAAFHRNSLRSGGFAQNVLTIPVIFANKIIKKNYNFFRVVVS